uniref:ubiquitinyl hydrolase 1 n=1 Tax=Compsopogon caeruleus TaxID=31354 RepID=A0A6T6CPK4_9RHOD
MRDTDAKGILSPQKLFTEIGARAPRFRGRAQQDSHELLRVLCDALIDEEAEWIRKRIPPTDNGGGSSQKGGSQAPGTSSEPPATPARTRMDEALGGTLRSTIICQVCGFVSTMEERFLDLSLPLVLDDCNDNADLSDSHSSSARRPSTSRRHMGNRANSNGTRKKSWLRSSLSRDSTEELPPERSSTSESEAPFYAPTEGNGVDLSYCEPKQDFVEDEDIPAPPSLLDSESAADVETNGKEHQVSFTSSSSSDRPSPRPSTRSLRHRLGSALGFHVDYKGLPSSLEAFTRVEILDGDNGYCCEDCIKRSKLEIQENGYSHAPLEHEKQSTKATSTQKLARSRATKQFLIKEAPRVLALHLKRFSQNGYRGGLRKLSGHVAFPLTLDLAPYVLDEVEEILYDLAGLVSHGGSLGGGHYVAVVRTSLGDNGSQWFYCSDSHISRISESSVLATEAYLLFYERRTTSSVSTGDFNEEST